MLFQQMSSPFEVVVFPGPFQTLSDALTPKLLVCILLQIYTSSFKDLVVVKMKVYPINEQIVSCI